jgi:chromosome segregation ATPase
MADLIEGITAHTNHAPLSHGQTMSVSRHLQDQIRQLQQVLSDLGKGLSETNNDVGELRKQVGGNHNGIAQLNEEVKNANTKLESNCSDLGQNKIKLAKVLQGLENTDGKVAALIDGQKVNDTLLGKIQKEQGEQAQRQHEFKERMEKKVEADIRGLRDDFAKSDLEQAQMRGDAENLKNLVMEEKEALRQTNMRAKDAQDEFNNLQTFINILEKRVADGASNLKSTRENLEDLNNATLKLHEDHDNTKARLSEQGDNAKRTNNHVKQVHAKLEATAQAVNNAHEKIADQADHGETLKQALDHANSRIQSVTEGNAQANSNITDLKRQLADTEATARAVKAGLKESNSLLLPNLHLDSHEARSASQRHGSLLHTGNIAASGTGPAFSPKRTPRGAGATLTPQNWT